MTITPLPTPPDPNDPATFNTRAANWVAALQTWTNQVNALPNMSNIGGFNNGAEATPSVTFNSDLDTGMWRPGANIVGFSTNGTERARITDNGMQVTGTITGTAVIQNSTDTTSNRLLRLVGTTGAFGLGGTFAPALADMDATTTPTGLYFFNFTNGTTTGTAPPGFQFGGVLVLSGIGSSPQAPLMIAVERTSGSGRMAWRTSAGGTWGSWQYVFGNRNAVGTVSQSGGTPTGTLFETGDNANGRYIRLADGTQKCWRTMTASNSAATTWTFPAAFSAAPIVTGNAVATVLSAVCLDAAPGANSCTFSARDKNDARRADTVHLFAVGRWF